MCGEEGGAAHGIVAKGSRSRDGGVSIFNTPLASSRRCRRKSSVGRAPPAADLGPVSRRVARVAATRFQRGLHERPDVVVAQGSSPRPTRANASQRKGAVRAHNHRRGRERACSLASPRIRESLRGHAWRDPVQVRRRAQSVSSRARSWAGGG